MYNKLKIIKMFFGTILTILCIIGIIQSCSYAYTINDVLELAEDSYDYQSTNLKSAVNMILTNWEDISESISQDDSTSNYNSFTIRYYQDSSYRNYAYLDMAQTSGTSTYTTNNTSSGTLSNCTRTRRIRVYITNDTTGNYITKNNIQTGTTLSITGIYGQNIMGLLDISFNENFVFNQYPILNNYYSYFDIYENNYTINDYQNFIGTARVGTFFYNENLNFQLLDANNNRIQYLTTHYLGKVNGGYQYGLYIPNTQNIISGNYYTVLINNNNVDILQSNPIQLFTQNSNGNNNTNNNAPIITQSGEQYIDLTSTNNKIDNVNNSIISGDKAILEQLQKNESGEQARQTFWEKAYNDLFTISGDYITKKFEEIREKYKISGDYEIEQSIINTIQDNANDFIISWEAVETHFSFGNYEESTKQLLIPSGEINFSKMERENQDFHTTMEWARTIIGFSLGMLLLRNYWTTLMLTLGIGIQVYDKETQEKNAINQTITIDKNGKQTMTTTQKIGNLTIRRKK